MCGGDASRCVKESTVVTLLIFLRAVRLQRDRFQMELASLKRHNYLDTENRNTETKLFSISHLHSWFWMGYTGLRMKARIKDGNLSKLVSHAISSRKWAQHQFTLCLTTPGCYGNTRVSRSGTRVVLQFRRARAHTHSGSTSASIRHPTWLISSI